MKEPKIRFIKSSSFLRKQLKDIAIINPKCSLPEIFEYVDLESVIGTEMKNHRTEKKGSAPSRAQRLAQKGDIFFQTALYMTLYLLQYFFSLCIYKFGS